MCSSSLSYDSDYPVNIVIGFLEESGAVQYSIPAVPYSRHRESKTRQSRKFMTLSIQNTSFREMAWITDKMAGAFLHYDISQRV